jgi:hypothetical protein
MRDRQPMLHPRPDVQTGQQTKSVTSTTLTVYSDEREISAEDKLRNARNKPLALSRESDSDTKKGLRTCVHKPRR